MPVGARERHLTRPRFNGAAARELRMRQSFAHYLGGIAASMGPQLVSCGCRTNSTASLACGRFNGAAARELRMRSRTILTHAPPFASMGPQLVSCGCMPITLPPLTALMLQWGRSS